MLREVVVPVTVWCLAAIPHVVYAQEPDWETMSYTSHADFQAVDSMGFGTFPLTEPIRMQGVVLNRSADMLDPAPAAPGFLGGLWQVYVQSPEPTDFGGTALWMGQYIGKIVGNHPDGSYTDLEWLAELDRLSHDPDTGYAFQVGDKVEIRARAPGLHFRGKNNVNEQHTNDPGADFDVVLLEPDFGLPSPELITLSDLKDASDNFIFDADRLIGCEHYQGTLVRVNDISFVDTTDWGPDAVLVIQDGTGRTFPVKLGCGDGHPGPGGSRFGGRPPIRVSHLADGGLRRQRLGSSPALSQARRPQHGRRRRPGRLQRLCGLHGRPGHCSPAHATDQRTGVPRRLRL